MTEHEIQQRILIACGSGNARLWRNNVGTGWAGQTQQVTLANRNTIGQTLQPGDVIVRRGRPLHAGLCVGSSDLIGYRQIGGVAQFVALEVKSATGQPSPEQSRFLDHILSAGGCAGVVRSVEDAHTVLRQGV
ncbi:MAG: VRR-NUC domain-containing protein [Vulcanococcus sp.]